MNIQTLIDSYKSYEEQLHLFNTHYENRIAMRKDGKDFKIQYLEVHNAQAGVVVYGTPLNADGTVSKKPVQYVGLIGLNVELTESFV